MPAAAAPLDRTAVVQPLQPLPALDVLADAPVAAGAGDGIVAWTTSDTDTLAQRCAGLTVWTLRDGAPVRAARVPDGCRADEMGIDVGTATDGRPVAVVRSMTSGPTPLTRTHLVDLRTGRLRTAPKTLRGEPLTDVAVDAGVAYASTTPRGRRATSTLWRGTLRGTRIVAMRRIRTYPSGLRAAGLLADGGRIAVRTTGHPRPYPSFHAGYDLRFGRPSGPWTRTGETWATDGGYVPVLAAGFTRSGALVTVQPRDGQGGGRVYARAVPPRHGGVRRSWVRLPDVAGPQQVTADAYDATTGRFLVLGRDAAGVPALGWTAPARR